MQRSTKTTVIIIGVVTIASLIILGTKEDSIEVSIAEATTGLVESTVTNTRAGSVTACRRAKLAPHVGGQIAKLHVTEGNKVKDGEVLVELWNLDKKAQLELAENEAVSSIAKAKETCVRYEVASKEAKRLARLLKQGLTSEETADTARGNADAAKSACDAANGLSEVAASRVKVVEAELERTIVRAPFDGIVAEVNGEKGEFVTPSPIGVATLPVVDLIDYQCIYVAAPIDEVDAPNIKADMTARILLDAFPNHPFEATVKKISPYVQDFEKQARTVNVDVYFSNTIGQQLLLPGYSADAEIILDRKENVLRIPSEAIFDDEFVYRLSPDDNTIEKLKIVKGIGNCSFTEISSGLNQRDKVVTSIGIEGLSDGVEVAISDDSN